MIICEINRIFSGMSAPKQAPPLFFPHCTVIYIKKTDKKTKKKTIKKTHRTVTSMPRRVLNRDFCETFHPQIHFSAICNKQKNNNNNDNNDGNNLNGSLRSCFLFLFFCFFCFAGFASTFTKVNTNEVIYFFTDSTLPSRVT